MTQVKDFVGQKDATAQWFITPTDVSGDHLDYERENILMEVSKFTKYAVHGSTVVMRVPSGRVMMTRDGALTWFSYVPKDRWELLRFWMNTSSVKDVWADLEKALEKKRPFDELFFRW